MGRRRGGAYVAILVAALLGGGCAAPEARRPAALIELPQARQATDYTCGVAVAQSLLAYNGHLYRQDVLEARLEASPEWGTRPEAIMACLEEYGIGTELRVGMALGDLQACLDAGRPVICFLQAWNGDPDFDYSDAWDDGHYAVAIGYDEERVYFMDPSVLANYAYIPIPEFLARWHDGNETTRVHRAGIVVENPTPAYRRDEYVRMR